jgi:hypothetical protein
MDIRRIWLCKDVVLAEGGLPALKPVTRVAACAVIANPAADQALDDLSELVGFGADLGARLVREALALLPAPGGGHPVTLCICLIYGVQVFLWRGDERIAAEYIRRAMPWTSPRTCGQDVARGG